MQTQIIKTKIPKGELAKITKENYGEMVKVDVWGVNFYPWRSPDERIEYNALINIKPTSGHDKMEIRDNEVKQKIRNIIEKILLSSDETL